MKLKNQYCKENYRCIVDFGKKDICNTECLDINPPKCDSCHLNESGIICDCDLRKELIKKLNDI